MAGLGIALLYMAFKGNDPQKIYEDLKKADYTWVIIASVCALLANFSRAKRWIILLDPIGYKPSVMNTFYAVSIGYFANIAFPRLGEVSRCTVLNQSEKVPFESAVGTVISERIIDVISLALLLVAVFFTQYSLMNQFFHESILPQLPMSPQSLLTFIIPLFIIFSLLAFYIYKNVNAFEKKVESSKFLTKLWGFGKRMGIGVKSVLLLKKKWAFLFYTVFMWCMYFLMTYICVFTIPATSHLSPSDGLFLLVAGSIGMIVPAPGGIGPFEFFISKSILLFGLTEIDGLVYASILHGSQILFTIILGSLSFLMLFLSRKKSKA